MRLYTLAGATAITDPDYGEFTADENGGFDLPDDLSDRLRRFPGWETDVERQNRQIAEEIARREDPKTLLAEVEKLVHAMHAAGQLVPASATSADAVAPAPAPKSTKATKATAAK